MMSQLLDYFLYFYLSSAPYLLLGFIVAGLLHQFLPKNLLDRYLQGESLWTIFKASIFGTPIPLCSCGVVPTALSLHRKGLSSPATSSFLVATPENGVESLALTYSLFGGPFTVIRLVCSLIVANVTGILVKIFPESLPVAEKSSGNACCKKESTESEQATPNGFKFVVHDFLPEIINWLLFGFLLAVAIQFALPPETLGKLHSETSLILIAFIGVPVYICASASSPIALSLLLQGLSPGACIVFLLTGPATNIANFPIIAKEMGKKTLIIHVVSILLTSISMGYLVDLFFADLAVSNVAPMNHEHFGFVTYSTSILLAILLAYCFLYKNFKKFFSR